MKIFISSLIGGMEPERAAVKRAVESLGHQPIMAEGFGARATSPQIACLGGVREADLVVLLLGERYGVKQSSGFSATHEEYLAARGNKDVLMFLNEAMQPDPDQTAFIREVSGWEGGGFRGNYSSPESLRDTVTTALHRYEMAHNQAPLDPTELQKQALALLPAVERDRASGAKFLNLAISGGPRQSLLRPAELEQPALVKRLSKEAVYGDLAIFDPAKGTRDRVVDTALRITQDGRHGEAGLLQLWESGDLLVRLPLPESLSRSGLSALIEEDIQDQIAAALAYASWLLDSIDSTHKLTHVSLAVRLDAGDYEAWRTRSEHAASPNSMSIAMGGDSQRRAPVQLSPAYRPRTALAMDAKRITEDLMTLLRRRWNS